MKFSTFETINNCKTGGFETSSTALSFCLFELALNPDIQSKARCAIKEAFKKYNGQFTYEMLTDIPYVNQLMEGKFGIVINLDYNFHAINNFSCE